jgi:hypothetical protein
LFTLELYTSSVTAGSLLQVTSLYSGVTPTLNSGFQVPQLSNLGGVYTCALTNKRAQMQSPSMRTQPYPDFAPVNIGAGLFESPVRGVDLMRYPLPLSYTEELDMFAWVTTTHIVYGAILLTDGPVPQTSPQAMRTVHATGATTLSAGAWTTVPLTLDQALPAGVYNLMGAKVVSATGVVFKFIPAMGPLWQPGGIANQVFDGMTPDGQRYGGWGTWLTFQQNVLPSLNLFATAADTAQDAWLDLVKVG